MRKGHRLFGALLHLYPPAFRRRFGPDMRQTMLDARGAENAAVFWRGLIGDTLVHASAAWIEVLRGAITILFSPSADFTRPKGTRMDTLWQDARYAIRTLIHRPGFTSLAVFVLALGIGANTAIFSLVDSALIRPLRFPHPEQLTMVWEAAPAYAHNRVAPLNFLDWREQNHVFSGLAGVVGSSRTLTGVGGTAEKVPGQTVTDAFFGLLGVHPILGRTFIPDDTKPGILVTVIGERFWRDRFGADPTLVGRPILLDSRPFTVIGVVAADFQLLAPSDVWTTFEPPHSPEQRRGHFLQVVGRLKPDSTIEQARADMHLIAENIARVAPETNKGWGVTIEPLGKALVSDDLRTTSLALAGIVALILLMSCANVASLLLARGISRGREVAVRAAIGASRGRILRQLLIEDLLLAGIGGAAGLALAWGVVRIAPAVMPPGTLPASVALMFDSRLVAFATALSLLTAFLCGLAPAWHSAQVAPADALAAGGRGSTRRTGTLRSMLAVMQIATAVLLASGAGLLLRTVMSLNQVDPGYRPDRVLTMYVSLPVSRYRTPDRALGFYNAIEREIAAVSGVQSVAVGANLPLDGIWYLQGFDVIGKPAADKANLPSAHYQMVSARYFDTLGIPVIRGRTFTDHDTAAAAPVCVVNEEFVRKYLNHRDPIGSLVNVQQMSAGDLRPVVREVVGVIGQVKVEGPDEKENWAEIYVPIKQNPWFTASIAIKSAGDPLMLAPAIKAAIARVDKDQPVTRVRTIEQVAADATATPRFRAELVIAFATIAIVLASAGVFGILAFSVGQRLREFGIRLALGARGTDLMWLVIEGGLKLVLAGVAIGLVAAAGLTRSIQSLLFGVGPLDPVTFALTPAVLVLTSLVACIVPAARAARVDPAETLRQE